MRFSPRIGIWVILLGWTMPPASGEFAPKAYPLEGMPKEARRFRSPILTPGGWMGLADRSLFWQENGILKFSEVPDGNLLRVCIPLPDGSVIVGGLSGCHLRTPAGVWKSTDLRENVHSGVATGSGALVTGGQGVHYIAPSGQVKLVWQFKEGILSELHVLGGRTVLFTNDEVLEWDGSTFRKPGDSFRWNAPKPAAPPRWTAHQANGSTGWLANTERGLVYGGPKGESGMIPIAGWTAIYNAGVTGVAWHGDCVYVISTGRGLEAFSFATGRAMWNIPPASLGSPSFFVTVDGAGNIIVSTANALKVVPLPAKIAVSEVQQGPIRAAAPSKHGMVYLVGPRTLRRADGGALDTPLPQAIEYHGVREMKDGSLAILSRVTIYWKGKEVRHTSEHGQVMDFSESRDGRLLVLHLDGAIRILLPSGADNILAAPAKATFLGLREISANGEMLLVSNQGAFRLSPDGHLLQRFGTGNCELITEGEVSWVRDSRGHIYNTSGIQVANLPFADFGKAVVWRGKFCLFTQTRDGEVGLAMQDDHGGWSELDFPAPENSAIPWTYNGALLLQFHNEIIAMSDPILAPKANASFTLAGPRGEWKSDGILRSDEDWVEFTLPPPRLAPWRNPAFAWRIDAGEWQTIPAGARVRVPRIPWGRTAISVRSRWATSADEKQIVINRSWPWWAGWRGWLLAMGSVGAAGYGLAHWRTLRLKRESTRLEILISTRTAELAKANAVKAEFIASLNHEVRNPMNGILGLTRMLGETALQPRQQALLQSLEACTAQLRATVDDVLDFRALDQGSVTLHETAFELGGLVQECCVAADPAGERVQVTRPLPGPLWVRGDQGKLRQILGNYLGNALKYGLPPQASVELSHAVQAGRKVAVSIAVSNPGPTLEPTELEQLFGLFYRGSRARSTGTHGSGLGLAICRKYAEALGGRTDVVSADGLTTFGLHVALDPAAAPPTAEAPASLPLATQLRGRILAIEDEPYNRLVLDHYLHRLGFEVDWAERGAVALELAAGGGHDLIVSDWFLPDMEGAELLRKIKATLGTRTPPLVVLSAHATTQKQSEALAAGADLFLSKPIDERKLGQALAQFNLAAATSPIEQADTDLVDDHHDLSALLLLGPRENVIPDYLRQLEATWSEVGKALRIGQSMAPALVHRLRSQVLLVRATQASDQLLLLEAALAEHAPPHLLSQLAATAGDAIGNVAAALRRQVSQSQSGLSP